MTLAASPLLADFSYRQTSTITGGLMASVMKVAGVYFKPAREPIRSAIAVKAPLKSGCERDRDLASAIDGRLGRRFSECPLEPATPHESGMATTRPGGPVSPTTWGAASLVPRPLSAGRLPSANQGEKRCE
jgi:hypothetical protein